MTDEEIKQVLKVTARKIKIWETKQRNGICRKNVKQGEYQNLHKKPHRKPRKGVNG